MEALFDKSNIKKWTIIVEHIDNDNMTAYVQNWGWDENQLIREFKKANTNGFEKDISENELKTLLQTVIVNYNIIGVYEISNTYNTDMKTINKIKTNREEFLRGKGYTIVNHCEAKIEYSKDCDQIYTTRGLLKLYSDQCKALQTKITTLEEDCEEIDDIHNIKTKQLAELNTRYINAENDLNKLIERYRNGVKELKKIESEIELAKENLPGEVKELMDKKESLLLTVNLLEPNVDKLTKEEADKKDKINQMVNKLSSIEDEYYKRQNEYNDLKSKYNDLKNAYDELIETVSSVEGIL